MRAELVEFYDIKGFIVMISIAIDVDISELKKYLLGNKEDN